MRGDAGFDICAVADRVPEIGLGEKVVECSGHAGLILGLETRSADTVGLGKETRLGAGAKTTLRAGVACARESLRIVNGLAKACALGRSRRLRDCEGRELCLAECHVCGTQALEAEKQCAEKGAASL